MKVYIGPHTPWWTSRVFRDYMDKKYKYDWSEANTTFEKILEKIQDSLQWIYSHTANPLFAKMERKINVRIDAYDTWSMDNTLAHIIHPMLIQFQAGKHGAPFVDDEDVPDELKSISAPPKENEWDLDDNHFKRWDWVLAEMVHAFECEMNEDWEDQFHSGEHDLRWKKLENGLCEMYHGPNHTHVFDKENHDKAWNRRKNGLRLFAKYYHNLWT